MNRLLFCVLGLILAFKLCLGTIVTDLSKVKIYFVYGSDPSERQSYTFDKVFDILKHSKFDDTKKTALYIHAYLQSVNDPTTVELIRCFLICGEYNILILDWSEFVDGEYIHATIHAEAIGVKTAHEFVGMFNSGLTLDRFHVIGHSLGAAMAGIFGSQIQQLSVNRKIVPRITGLDPAGPGYFKVLGILNVVFRQLKASDAKFVDVIHTDAGFLGSGESIGTVEFFPNGGTRFQPGCPIIESLVTLHGQTCSHERSAFYFAQSLVTSDPVRFLSVQARSLIDFKLDNLIGTRVAQMGINCPLDLTGKWYLTTDSVAPYTLDTQGTHFDFTREGLIRGVVNTGTDLLSSVIGLVLYK